MVKHLIHITFLSLGSITFSQTFEVAPIESELRGSVYSPAFHNGKIVVCSDQKDRVLGKTVLDLHDKEPVDLYILDPENPADLSRFVDEFRTIYNDGPISFNAAADACVISMNLKTEQNIKGLQEDHNPLGLFISKKYAGLWSYPGGLSFNNQEYNCSHPAMSADGRTIIFTSNMPGGQGGYDLWMTTYDAGIWSRPVNLGNRINSEKDELFPSIDNDQIYFASDRGEFGGLDIYYTDLNTNREVRALSAPINSDADDFGLITRNGLENGYFTTNRNGQDALWKFEFKWPDFNTCDSLIEEDFCYTLFEENAQELEDVGSLIYEWSINGVKRRGVSIRYCFPGPGDYEINLDVIDTNINETYFNQAYYYISLEYAIQPYIECPDTVRPGVEFELSGDKTNIPGAMIDSYFWDFGDGRKTIGRDVKHSFQIPGTYRVQLGVVGQDSDSVITDCVYKTVVCMDTNIVVKDNIANLIPSTLANSEIVKEVKFFNVGPEDEGFIAYTIEAFRSNTAVNLGEFPYTLLEQYSSRVEYNEEEQVYIYYVGEYEKFTEAHNTWLTLKERGFEDAILRSILMDESPVEISLTEKFVLEHVNFDVAKWDIRPDAIPDLEKIISIMRKAPEYNLEISAHTDNNGDRQENYELSNKRATAVKEHLIQQGINGGRISAKGYGQDRPIDTNETEEGRQRNRRVEFKFRKA